MYVYLLDMVIDIRKKNKQVLEIEVHAFLSLLRENSVHIPQDLTI